ncbi:hypothetical protein CJ030_MR7G018898 [Morella rubra]|uniref:Uncharacterized protein n=1 Tax=Morella rubra TaxID=262757 RepID=A0A6A1V2Y1_9ROSI|nr:hypothetical protein CJ030_MR7G018901 [Morella rubra]KAB1206371.1 hypothetical protein CJ030_MR7G018898 [Morella rubra]
MDVSSGSIEHNIRGIPTHGGRYVQYNVYGNLFEVSRKYIPPIRPVGRGAYGIVCAMGGSRPGPPPPGSATVDKWEWDKRWAVIHGEMKTVTIKGGSTFLGALGKS